MSSVRPCNQYSSEIRIAKFESAVQSDLQVPRRPGRLVPVTVQPLLVSLNRTSDIYLSGSVEVGAEPKNRTPKPWSVAAQHELSRRSLLRPAISARLNYSAHERPKIEEKKTSGVRYGS